MMKIPLLDLKAQYASIRDEINTAIEGVLDSQRFILGPTVQKFENEIAGYCDVQFAVGLASGSDALLISLMALDIENNDEVITTPYTFFATAGSISRLGARPVFVDIDPVTYNINSNLIEEKISKKTKAIIPVHLYGQCADMKPILEIAGRHKIPVIEDAAQAIGAKYKGRMAGSLGTLGCLSFFPSKNLGGYGDGGMILTNDPELAEKIRILRSHGARPKYFHDLVGCNSRLDAIQAAILSVKLKYLDHWSDKRREHAELYNQLFENTDIVTPVEMPRYRHIYNQYVIRIREQAELRRFLKEKGIATEIYYPVPLHMQKCFSNLGCKQGDFRESEMASKHTLALPVFPELTEEMQKYVSGMVLQFGSKGIS